MKNYLNKFITVGILSLIILSCKQKDEYDWAKVFPGKQIITGSDSIKGNNIDTSQYFAIPRGGSKYDWVVVRGPLTITEDKGHPFIAVIKANSEKDTNALITVTETTWGGVQGTSDSFSIKISCFTPFNMEQLLGNGQFNCYEMNYFPYKVNITYVGGDTIENNNFFITGWKLKYVLSEDKDEIVKIVPASFNLDGETVYVKGQGHYSVCDREIKINFAITTLFGDTITNGAGLDRFVHL